jgi:hypothetical protein
MGTWGYRPFDNDMAADFAADLDQAPESARLDVINNALQAVSSCAERIDGARAEVAVAAAALVARDLDGGEEFQSKYYGPMNPFPPMPRELIVVAADVVGRIINRENDLKEYWIGAQDSGKWFAAIGRLRKVLAGDPSAMMDPLW